MVCPTPFAERLLTGNLNLAFDEVTQGFHYDLALLYKGDGRLNTRTRGGK